MKLVNADFHSYASLVNCSINFNHSCIGLVGVNESGKTNVLKAIMKMDSKNPLNSGEKPKMNDSVASITFKFKLNKEEVKGLLDILSKFCSRRTLDYSPKLESTVLLTYNIKFDKIEKRTFSLQGIKNASNQFRFQQRNAKAKGYKIYHNGIAHTLKDVLALDNSVLAKEKQNLESNKRLQEVEQERADYLSNRTDSEGEADSSDDRKLNKLDKEIEQLRGKITFNMGDFVAQIEEEISDLEIELDNQKKELEEKENLRYDLEAVENPNAQQEKQLEEYDESIEKDHLEINRLDAELREKKESIEDIYESLSKQFGDDNYLFVNEFVAAHNRWFEEKLPRVIFWESLKEYILPSSIRYSEILKFNSKSGFSRPLMNLFRLGLGLDGIEELKSKIKELMDNGSKRSSAELMLNSKLNEYIHEVWQDFNQKLKITLEESQIRVEIYDPERNESADFYELLQRSQGCQTFLSFLLTIGAESKKGFLTGNILLLDEPESHLHPTGQRYMLEELLKISKVNTVVYATHSNHMIIKNNYDQHIIVKKQKDCTDLIVSQKDRVGFFLQEEVLYSALGVDLSSDVSSIHNLNFVFEGVSDILLFQHYYEKVLNSKERPNINLKDTYFFQGGKCSDILKTFKNRPIQLGTKWIFILDSDDPAHKLRSFLESKYKRYISSDIFVYQYPKIKVVGELEDLMPIEVILQCYEKTVQDKNIEVNKDELKKLVDPTVGFSSYSNVVLENLNLANTEEFKSLFKANLNSSIGELCKKLKNEEFVEYFARYKEFANETIKDIGSKISAI